MASRSKSSDIDAKRTATVRAITESLRRGEGRHYYVGLAGYFIEGYPYSATGLTVDLNATPDIKQTEAGFSCTATFPAKMIREDTLRHKDVKKVNIDRRTEDLVQVQLEVKLCDIWLIAEFVEGRQQILFEDPETCVTRNKAFLAETAQFFRPPSRLN